MEPNPFGPGIEWRGFCSNILRTNTDYQSAALMKIFNLRDPTGSSKVRVQRKNALRALLTVMMISRHHSGLLVFADAALEKVRLALHRDQIHPVKGIRRVVQRRAACTHRDREM